MSEHTARFFVLLSHQWMPIALMLPVLFGVAVVLSGKQQARAQAAGNVAALRVTRITRLASFTLCGLSVVLALAAFFHVGCASTVSHQTRCLNNMKQLALGILTYAQDYDERLPPSSQWSELITGRDATGSPYLSTATADTFRCPASESPFGYGMNTALDKASQTDIVAPADTVLMFEADASRRSFTGGAKEMVVERHSGMPGIAFSDGHVKSANEYTRNHLLWSPTENRTPDR